MRPYPKNQGEREGGLDQNHVPPGGGGPLADTERGLAVRGNEMDKGTGVEEATHPSTGTPVKEDAMKTPIPEKKEFPPRQGCQAGGIRVIGFAQNRVSESQCPGVVSVRSPKNIF